MNKNIFTIRNIALFIFAIFLLFGFIRIVRSCSRIFSPSSLLPQISSPLMGEGKGEGEIPVRKSIKLFGTKKSELTVEVPPQPKTIEFKVTENLKVYSSDSSITQSSISKSKIRITKSYTLIRFHPTLHLCILLPLTTNIQQLKTSFSPGLKLRFLEIWRFGTAAYLTTKGPGLGIDFALISNLSLDYCRLLNSHNLGLSLKL